MSRRSLKTIFSSGYIPLLWLFRRYDSKSNYFNALELGAKNIRTVRRKTNFGAYKSIDLISIEEAILVNNRLMERAVGDRDEEAIGTRRVVEELLKAKDFDSLKATSPKLLDLN